MIDLVFFDLVEKDEANKFVYAIENKYLTQDSENQLNNYYTALKDIYPNISVKLIYLTLDGRDPKYCTTSIPKEDLINISWINDILPIINKIEVNKNNYNKDGLKQLKELLVYIKELSNRSKNNLEDNNCLKNYIKEILSLNSSKINNFDVKFLGNCYSLNYKKIKVFIPLHINKAQSNQIIIQFCKLILESNQIEINTKKISFDNCFNESFNKLNISEKVISYLCNKNKPDIMQSN